MIEFRKLQPRSTGQSASLRPFAEVDPAEIPVEEGASPDEEQPIWDAPVDICEDQFDYLVIAGIPGVPIADVVVRVVNGVLEIRATKTQRAAEQGRRYFRIERQLGVCRRLFELPADADAALMRYELRDGVLRIRLPKNPPSGVGSVPPIAHAGAERKPLPKPPLISTDAVARTSGRSRSELTRTVS